MPWAERKSLRSVRFLRCTRGSGTANALDWRMSLADWNPGSFEVALQHVMMARSGAVRHAAALALLRLMTEAIDLRIRTGASPCLSCPPPSDDPDGTYRVTLWAGKPVIERRLDSGVWERFEEDRVTLEPPAPKTRRLG